MNHADDTLPGTTPRDGGDIETLRQAYRDRPDDADAAMALAQTCADRGWFNEAIDVYMSFLDAHPDDYACLLDYGNICFRRQTHDEAMRVFKKLTLLRPARVEGWNNLGILQLMTGDIDNARHSFEKVLAIEPDNAGALLNIGNYFEKKNDFTRALEFFKRAISLHPDFADAWYNAGNAHLHFKEYDKAIEAYLRAMRYQPEFPSAMKNAGYSYEQAGDLDKAEEYYLKALRHLKADATLHVNVANVYLKRQRFEEAKRHFISATRLAPRDPAAWMGLRELALKKGNIESYTQATIAVVRRLDADLIAESVAVCRQLHHHDKADLLIRRADALGKKGDALDAERMLAYQRWPDHVGAAAAVYRRLCRSANPSDATLLCLAFYANSQEQYARAAAHIRAMKQRESAAHRALWDALIGMKEWEQAMHELDAYMRDHQDSGDGWFHAAKIHAATGRIDAARQALINALENGFADIDTIRSDDRLWAIYTALDSTAQSVKETKAHSSERGDAA